MKISVIIPTYNAERYIPELLGSLQIQTVNPDEIIVVDSSSTDRTTDLARQFGANVLVIEKEQFDHGGTRNYAAKQATGDVLVFMTQDALPQDDRFLEELVKPLSDPQAAAVSGRQVARSDASVLERMTREINYPHQYIRKSMEELPKWGIKTFYFTNVCSAIRKDVFEELGGFPEPMIVNEDMIIAATSILRGYSVIYNPEAAVIHSHNYSLWKQFQRNFDIGASLSMNGWILKYATAEKEGLKLIKQQLGMLWHEGHWYWIPKWFAEAGAKYIGYRLGLAYRSLPIKLRKRFSMHAYYWRQDSVFNGEVAIHKQTAGDSRMAGSR